MRRRRLLALLGAAALAPRARAESAVPVIGVLSNLSSELWDVDLPLFSHGLAESGFAIGQNVAVQSRFAEGHYDRLPALAAELVALKVAVIVAIGGPSPVAAVKKATSSIPIVFGIGEDPVALGIVPNLNHPGGNVTGASFFFDALAPKQIELAHNLLPKAGLIAVLINPDNPNAAVERAAAERAATTLGIKVIFVPARVSADLPDAVAAADANAGALVIITEPLFSVEVPSLVVLSAARRLPLIGFLRYQTTSGALASYGGSLDEAYQQAGVDVGRILKGTNPGDLPVTLATKFETVINLKTANALGITVPPTVLALADEVIE